MVKIRTLALVVALSLGAVSACEDSSSSAKDLEVTESGACGDVLFWAFADDGRTAVTVDTDLRDRASQQQTEVDFSVPSKDVNVQILELNDPNFCNDLGPPPPPQAAGRDPVAGSGSITVGPALDPAKDCGHVDGELTLTGLEAADGTTFAPIHVTSSEIGCYAG